jgi:hypothetical protein
MYTDVQPWHCPLERTLGACYAAGAQELPLVGCEGPTQYTIDVD